MINKKKTNHLSSQQEYWVNEFVDEIPVLDMPLDYVRPIKRSFDGAMIYRATSKEVVGNIKDLSRQTGATTYMILLAVAMVTLSKYSRQEDIVIGSPVSTAKLHKDTEEMLGMVENTLAMRGRPEGKKKFLKFLQEIKETCLKAYENQEYRFDELVKAVGVLKDISRNPLFDVMLVLKSNEEIRCQLNGVDINCIKPESKIVKFDLTFNIYEQEDEIKIGLEYCTALFKEESAQRILDNYVKFLNQITENAEALIEELDIVTEEERRMILGKFNDTREEYPRDKTVVELFEEQVERTPENIAVVFEEEEVTYWELNARANQVARLLREYGVRPDDFVAIMAERSIEMIVGIYGIIKAGGAYVPLDPGYPLGRIKYMLEDCRPKVVLVYKAEIETVIPIIDLADDQVFVGLSENPERVNKPEDLIYCIYTSGTTGKPKGVPNIHRGLINRIVWMNNEYSIGCGDIILQAHTYTFDISVCEIMCWSIVGARLGLLEPSGEKEPYNICNTVEKYGVTVLNFVPSMLMIFEEYLEKSPQEIRKLKSLRIIFIGGEALKPHHIEKYYRISNKSDMKADLINIYGPTEASIDVTYYFCQLGIRTVPIGRPISNTQIYIMNGKQLCGIGMPGELCIAGDGLARGYLNQPKLTAEKFVKNPFGIGRMYRTGDLAKWMPDGNIEYLDRIDEQVKIRGFRIELGEIESKLGEIDGVKDTAVIVREDGSGDKAIYAYVVSDDLIIISEIREQLSKTLPEYMVPTYMMQIEKLPVTRNGKLDKRALPEIEAKSEKEYIAPRNEIEAVLCRVFEEILGVEKVGVKDSFFGLGGDSIKAIRVVSKTRDYGYEVTIKDVMQKNVVENIAIKFKILEETHYEQGEVIGQITVTPIMKDFQLKKLERPAHYNQSAMLHIEKETKEDEIKSVLYALLEHHDILRSVYHDGNLEILSMAKSQLYDYEIIEVEQGYTDKQVEAECTRIQETIDLENGPLMKVALIRGLEESYLFFVLHHLVVDGVSWRILMEDFHIALSQVKKKKLITLPTKTASFKEWSQVLGDYKQSPMFTSERIYWERMLLEIGQGRLKEPLHHERTGSGTIKIVFSPLETKKLIQDSRKAFTTEINDLLLSALGMAVHQIMGQNKLTILLEGHGREEIHEKINIDRTVGWFTSLFPVVLDCTSDIVNSIVLTKEKLRNLPNHGIGYGLLQDEFPKVKADIYFNYLGEMDGEIKRNLIPYSYDMNSSAENKMSGSVLFNLSEINAALKTESIPYTCGMNSSAENKMSGSIIFSGSIMKGQLSFSLSYDKSKMNDTTMEKLALAYKSCLNRIISFCVEQKETKKTTYDYKGESLSLNDINSINSLIRDIEMS